MVGMLQHPQLMPIYDAGEEDGHCYVVTEYVHGGRTLAAFCKAEDALPVDVVVEIIFKCAKALHYAHSRGVIHRDIKPSNILYTQEGDVRIIDFGIALVADSDLSRIEGIAGSPSYMSPEQVQGKELTNRSDLYSLGAVMYELLTGSRPFRGGNLAKLMHQIVYATPPPITRCAVKCRKNWRRSSRSPCRRSRTAFQERAGFRRGAHPRAPEAARTHRRNRADRADGAAAQAEVLP